MPSNSSARTHLIAALVAALSFAGAASCGSRSQLEWDTMKDGGTTPDGGMVPMPPWDASRDSFADRSIDARSERSNDVIDAGFPAVDACRPSCEGQVCGASDGCGGICVASRCSSGLRCAGGKCVCDPTSCTGCCMPDQCLTGTDRAACGTGGRACVTCSVGECAGGTCLVGSEVAITLFGGSGARGFVDDTWTWDGNAWLEHQGPGPSPRYGSAMASLKGTNIMFGGAGNRRGTFGAFDETWEWDGTSWSIRNVAVPPARWAFAMAALNDKVVLFGGYDGRRVLSDTWEWNGTSWTQRMVQGPPGRTRHAMATVKGKVLLFGGQTDNDSLHDTWEWDGNMWTERSVSPAPRVSTGHAMATLYDKAVLFGGGSLGPNYFLETWEWDGRAWIERRVEGPSGRSTPMMAALQGKIVLFGGVVLHGGSMYEQLADTWEWDGDTWTERNVSGPIGVSDAAMSSR